MKQAYVVKISPQGQITLPKRFKQQIGVENGQVVTIKPTGKGKMEVSGELPIEKYFGRYPGMITGGRDAAEFIREMRDEDWANVERKLGL